MLLERLNLYRDLKTFWAPLECWEHSLDDVAHSCPGLVTHPLLFSGWQARASRTACLRSRGKKGILFKKWHANTSSYLTFHSLLSGGNYGVTNSPVPTGRCIRLPCPESTHICFTFMGWFSLIASMLKPPWPEFCTYALPAIDKCQKRTMVCVFLYELGLHSIEHLLLGEMPFISNQSLVLPLNAKARLGWMVNLFIPSSVEETPTTSQPELEQELDGWKFAARMPVETLPAISVAVELTSDSALCAILHCSYVH